MSMLEPRNIDPNSIYANLETFPYNIIKRSVSDLGPIDCLHNEWPVHCFIAILQVALENETQNVFVMACMDVNLRWEEF